MDASPLMPVDKASRGPNFHQKNIGLVASCFLAGFAGAALSQKFHSSTTYAVQLPDVPVPDAASLQHLTTTQVTRFDPITEFSSPLLSWWNPPSVYHIDTDKNTLEVMPDRPTDMWMRTYYDWAKTDHHFNASALVAEIDSDLEVALELEFTFTPVVLSDQAGALVLVDENTWVKCGFEYFDNIPHVSAVVTSKGFSDWSTTRWDHWDNPEAQEGDRHMTLKLRITRTIPSAEQGPDMFIEVVRPGTSGAEEKWDLVRLLPFHSGDKPLRMGPFIAGPTLADRGKNIVFHSIRISQDVQPCAQC